MKALLILFGFSLTAIAGHPSLNPGNYPKELAAYVEDYNKKAELPQDEASSQRLAKRKEALDEYRKHVEVITDKSTKAVTEHQIMEGMSRYAVLVVLGEPNSVEKINGSPRVSELWKYDSAGAVSLSSSAYEQRLSFSRLGLLVSVESKSLEDLSRSTSAITLQTSGTSGKPSGRVGKRSLGISIPQ